MGQLRCSIRYQCSGLNPPVGHNRKLVNPLGVGGTSGEDTAYPGSAELVVVRRNYLYDHF